LLGGLGAGAGIVAKVWGKVSGEAGAKVESAGDT
jgi:hypothetical protein